MAGSRYVLKHEPLFWRGREVILFNICLYVCTIGSFKVLLIKDSYRVNDRLCIRLFDKLSKEPSVTLSVNSHELMGANEIIAKDYSENNGKN